MINSPSSSRERTAPRKAGSISGENGRNSILESGGNLRGGKRSPPMTRDDHRPGCLADKVLDAETEHPPRTASPSDSN